jgi:hypothetical protein
MVAPGERLSDDSCDDANTVTRKFAASAGESEDDSECNSDSTQKSVMSRSSIPISVDSGARFFLRKYPCPEERYLAKLKLLGFDPKRHVDPPFQSPNEPTSKVRQCAANRRKSATAHEGPLCDNRAARVQSPDAQNDSTTMAPSCSRRHDHSPVVRPQIAPCQRSLDELDEAIVRD